ncbi:MAG: hypothetical protein AYK22_09275 [Thermoplasmatales archaeon SG8-52-3]|nr:MAG: hypothetical protein AYK22_09275 [Thermoplasmatales archaeon SG8-52-3]
MISKKIVIMLLTIILLLVFSGCTENVKKENSNDDDWLTDYSPVHSIGKGNDDFWIVYPDNHANSSESVTHLSWVNDSLKEGCVLFVVHKTGCEACQPQADRTIKLADDFNEHVVFYDFDLTLGGSIETNGYDSYLYDPDGPPGYLAFTCILTIINNSGTLEYAWHSWELDVKYSDMEEWLKDGIYYWNQNRGDLR